MQQEVKSILLKLVKCNGNIEPLIQMGYEYVQVINFLNILLEEKLLTRDNNQILITEAGLNEIAFLNKKLNRKNASLWIEPAVESRVDKIDKNDVFLPNQNELSF